MSLEGIKIPVEGIFSLRLTFQSVDAEVSKLSSIMCVGLVQSVDGLKRKRLLSPREEGILPSDCAPPSLPWVTSLPYRFQFLKISLSVSLLRTHTRTHTPLVAVFLWRTLIQIGRYGNLNCAVAVAISKDPHQASLGVLGVHAFCLLHSWGKWITEGVWCWPCDAKRRQESQRKSSVSSGEARLLSCYSALALLLAG